MQSVNELSQTASISELLNSIPNGQMNPSSRTSLTNMINKVARYRSSARLLYRIAKKYPIARHMEAVPVTLPKSAFGNRMPDKIPPLELFLKESGVFHDTKKGRLRVFRLLQCNEQQASDVFARQTRKTLSEAKIHAEMQLIFHCEVAKYSPFPRAISSSKDACFLCNAFIQMHGKFFTPRCHGRLYPGWRLPIMPETAAFEQRFVQVLQIEARKSTKTLLDRGKRTVFPDPNESTVLTIPVTSSTSSSAMPQKDIWVTSGTASYKFLAGSSTCPMVAVADASDSRASALGAAKSWNSMEKPSSARSTGASCGQTAPTCSATVGAGPEDVKGSGVQYQTARGGSAVRLGSEDLPFSQRVTIDQRPMQLSYGAVTFLFEFHGVKDGRMCISQQEVSCIGKPAPINVLDIPTHRDLTVECSRGGSRFSVCISTSVFLEFEFTWSLLMDDVGT